MLQSINLSDLGQRSNNDLDTLLVNYLYNFQFIDFKSFLKPNI